jgi:hypothetical protein
VAHIQNHAIEIEEHALAQLDVDAVVAEERRLHPDGVSTCAKQLIENATPFFQLCLSGRIQRLAEITGALSPGDELGIERVVQLTGQHLLAFGHPGLVGHITSLSKHDDRPSNDLSEPSALAHGGESGGRRLTWRCPPIAGLRLWWTDVDLRDQRTVNRTSLRDFEEPCALLVSQLAGELETPFNALDVSFLCFAVSAIHGVHPRMTQVHRDVLQGPTLASRVQRDSHRRSGS